VAAALLLVSSLAAQQLVLPEARYFTHSGSSTSAFATSGFHFQSVYDGSNFAVQGTSGSISIQRIRFRAANSFVSPGGSVFGNVNVRLSSCPNDYASLSSSFAANRGQDEALCFSGSIILAPCGGIVPNSWVVDIPLQTPFAYDPARGDLNIEVDGSAPSSPFNVPPFAATSGQAEERASSVTAAAASATAGTVSGFAPIALLDLVGTGGYPSWTKATSTNNGTGCYPSGRSFHQLFANLNLFDLAGTTLRLTPNNSGGYDVLRLAATAFWPHGPFGLGMGDEQVVPCLLPAGFGNGLVFPGGVTSVLGVCSNGYLWLGNDLNADYSPSVASLLTNPTARLAPFWADLLPDAAHDVFYDIDPSGNAVYVTYDNVPTFEIGGSVALQVAIANTGVIEYRFGAIAGAPTTEVLTGFSPGNGAMDPGTRDLSAFASFATSAPEMPPLTLTANPPRIGRSVTHTISNIPPAALLSARMLGIVPRPGLDLGSLGAPGCALWIDNQSAASTLMLGGPTATATVQIPNELSLLGVTVIAQGLSLVPGINALGIETTNQNVLWIGNS
jgi:hypothetical protein